MTVVSEGLLTAAEKAALDVTVDLANRVSGIIGGEDTRRSDLVEIVGHIHAIQHAIMSQAAARAFPDRYRLLGGKVQAGNP